MDAEKSNEPKLPEGVSRWVFIIPGAAIGLVVGICFGWCPSSVLAAVLFGEMGWGGPGLGFVFCWSWCVLAATVTGGYLGFWVWRTDDYPQRDP